MSQQPLTDKVVEQYGNGHMSFCASRKLTEQSDLAVPELVCKALALAFPIANDVGVCSEVNVDVLTHLLLILSFAQEWIKGSSGLTVRECNLK